MSNYKIKICPLEYQYKDTDDYYTTFVYQVPWKILQHIDNNFLYTINYIAQVAFADIYCNNSPIKQQKGEILLVGAKSDLSILNNLKDALPSKYNVVVELQEPQQNKTTHNKDCHICCVDRRLHCATQNTHNDNFKLTHPGSVLFLDPLLKDFVPKKCILDLERHLQESAKSDFIIQNIDHHFGINGAIGCAAFAVMMKANQEIAKILNTPQGIIDMLSRVRDKLYKLNIASNSCQITATTIDNNETKTVYDLDSKQAISKLLLQSNLIP